MTRTGMWEYINGRPTNPPRRWATAAMWLLIAATPILVGAGLARSSQAVSDATREANQRDSAAAVYAADRAVYENARDERTRCEFSVEARAGSRARAFTNIDYVADVFDTAGKYLPIPPDLRAELDQLEAEERLRVEEQLPVLLLEKCPPVPTPPTPPPGVIVIEPTATEAP